jgi:2-polyprenyl-3-methyl-5-hydroxy-6-metoxy-1,4-benzoquinol methylase
LLYRTVVPERVELSTAFSKSQFAKHHRMMIKKFLKSAFRKFDFEITRIGPPKALDREEVDHVPPSHPYVERTEYGPSNIETKLALTNAGDEIFEYPDIVNLNHAVVKLLRDANRICELGCGTGKFAMNAVQDNPARFMVASEFDLDTHEWVKVNRKHQNIRYVHGPVSENDGPFDVVVAIEVIEHIADYRSFITDCQRLSGRALITTPNRTRSVEHFHAGPPNYIKHVREWTAGEFYWVLRSFYRSVRLFGVVSDSAPDVIPVNVDSHIGQLIADCSDAY